MYTSLREMEKLPFIKVRNISTAQPLPEDPNHREERKTYFLHDAMYEICDEFLIKPEESSRECKMILAWYDSEINKSIREERRRLGGILKYAPDPDLIVESLFYRMRVNPIIGYHWFLEQADQAIRSAETGLEMRLRDSMSLFMLSASPSPNSLEQSLSSKIDCENVKAQMPDLFDHFKIDSAMLWIKRLSFRGQNTAARNTAEQTLSQVEKIYNKNPDNFLLAFAEFKLWRGQAAMYSGNIEQAINSYKELINDLGKKYDVYNQPLSDFEIWRLCLVLGRAYNNLGYTCWRYLGTYHQAIEEFRRSIPLFKMASLDEELANTNDNMGRVYAELGKDFQAFQLIRTALDIRKNLGLTYREALSGNSLAFVQARFGQIQQAIRIIEDAQVKFQNAGAQRGIGVGKITEGLIYRNLAEMWREIDMSLSDAIRYTTLSEAALRVAYNAFTRVNEPIQTIRVLNEIGCCYRTRYLLYSQQKEYSENEMQLIFAQAESNLVQSIVLADQNRFMIEKLDSMQDLAVLLFRANRYSDAETYLEKIRQDVPPDYIISLQKGFTEVPVANCIDVYYKLMGQVELLAGGIVYARGTGGQTSKMRTSHSVFVETARLYLLAVAYFNKYAGESYVHRQTYDRIYTRFQYCDNELVRDLIDKLLPAWVEDYKLDPALVEPLFRDVFGLLS